MVDFGGRIIEGEIASSTARKLIKQWANLHRFELEASGVARKNCSGLRTLLHWSSHVRNSLIRVVSAEYVKGYELRIRFSDGVEKSIDFSRWLHGEVFRPLANKRQFKRFFIAGGTVCWPNGADLAPETLRNSTEASSAA